MPYAFSPMQNDDPLLLIRPKITQGLPMSTRVLVRPIGLDMVAVGGSTNAGGEIYRGSSAGKAEKRAVR
jgi:hypothetical protein